MAVQTPALKASRDIVVRRGGGREILDVPVLERLRQGSLRPGVTDQREQHSRVATLIKKKIKHKLIYFYYFIVLRQALPQTCNPSSAS